MHTKSLLSIAILSTLLSGCDLTDDEKEQLEEAAVNLEQIAEQIIITYPANDVEIEELNATLRADIPNSANANKLILLVDGVIVAEDNNGAPWQIEWPAYFFADGKPHTLLLKAVTDNDVEVRNTQQFQVVVPQSLTDQMSISSSALQLSNENSAEIELGEITNSTKYEIELTKPNGETIIVESNSSSVTVNELEVGSSMLRYRAILTNEDQVLTGPWSEYKTNIEVLRPEKPTVNPAQFVKTETGYDVTLSWPSDDSEVTYTIYWGYGDNLTNSSTIEGSEFIFAAETLQDLNWQLVKTNEFGHSSLETEVQEVYPSTEIAKNIKILELTSNPELQNLTDILTIEIPADIQTTKIELLVDGESIISDETNNTNQFTFPSYYFADNNWHDLTVRILTEESVSIESEVIEFMVNTSVLNNLEFTQSIDDLIIKDTNELSVEFASVPFATSYDIKVNDSITNTQSLGATISDLDIGVYNLQYRANYLSADNIIVNGPWSNNSDIVVQSPDMPEFNEPLIEWDSETQEYDITFSWLADDVEDNFALIWNNGVEQREHETSENSFTLNVSETGQYQWTVKRINQFGHESNIDTLIDISVGEFRTQLGGTQDEYGRRIIKANNGDYIIFATTESREITPALDNGTDPWVIRMNQSGEVLNDFVLTEGNAYPRDIIEATDGSIYLVTSDWAAENATLTKLTSNLELGWSVDVKPEDVTERFMLESIVEKDGYLVATGAEWLTVDNTSSIDSWSILTLSMENGEIVSNTAFADFDDVKLDSLEKVFINFDGTYMVSGTVKPLSDEENYMEYGAFVANLDADFTVTSSWHNLGEYHHGNVGDTLINENGKIVIIGQTMMDGSPAISVLKEDLTEHAYYQGNWNDVFYNASTGITESTNGNFWAVLKDSDTYPYPHPMVMVEYDEDLNELQRKYLLDEGGYTSESDFVLNEDGTITLLFSQGQNEYNNHDLVIKRFDPSK